MTQSAPFMGLAETLDRVRNTRSKNEKVKIISDYLRLLGPEDAEIAARMATGRASVRGSKDEAQVGYSTLLDVLKEVTGANENDVSKSYMKHGDLGQVAGDLLERKEMQSLDSETLTLRDVEDAFDTLRSAKGKGSTATRKSVVRYLILRSAPIEGKYIVKVLTGEMRTGLVTGLVEEAIARAYDVPRAQAARAHMLVGDLGTLAAAGASGKMAGLKMMPFRPVNFMLADPLPSAEEVADHFGKRAIAEYKYDGVRAQVHRLGGKVRIYSRRLEDITASFPEVARALGDRAPDVIIDGEIVPFSNGRPLPFQLLQRRLRRTEDFEEAAKNAPVVYFAFDLLLKGSRELMELPLVERRRELSRVIEGTEAMPAESRMVETATEVQRFFRKSRQLGYEGLVVKDPASAYVMGRRGAGWVKLKEELDTVDAVIVAAEYGHGKRAGVISDYTFAVRDGDSLRTIGKAYSGLTDAEIDEMTRKLKSITVVDFGYRRTVKPEVVVEVAFDSIQKSERHDSGYALRFPRIKRIRTDKSLADIDTLEKVQEIFHRQKLKIGS